MSLVSQVRTYDPSASVVFLKTNERFGGLSNMAPGFPLRVNGVRIRTSEALYQACRFPHLPDVQRRIIDEHSPMSAKMRSKPFRSDSRPDWDAVRVRIMRWCLRVKLAQHWREFGSLLNATDDNPIVEQSRKDDFWGAKVTGDCTLVGVNALGRLLMELRELLKSDTSEALRVVKPLLIPNFLLLRRTIETICASDDATLPTAVESRRPSSTIESTGEGDNAHTHLFDQPVASQVHIDVQDHGAVETVRKGDFMRYPAYRTARVHWLGDVPAHWNEKRAKYFYREVDERSATGQEELLSVSHTTGVTPRSQKNVTMFKAASYVGHKVAKPNDIVVNTMWAWMAALGVSKDFGIVSPSYGVYRPLKMRDYVPDFVDYMLRIPPLKWEYFCRSTGIRASRLRLYPDKFLDIPFPCPPLDEQDGIVAFLRAYDVRFRRLVRHKRRLIELAEERLNVLTQGILAAPGTIEIRLELAADVVKRPIDRVASEVYTPVGLYNRGRGLFHKAPTAGDELGDSAFFWIEDQDLILSGQFAWEGAVALAGPEDARCIASHRYPILRAKSDIATPAYLFAFFRGEYGQLLLDHHSRGAAGRNRPLNVRSLKKEKIQVPLLDSQKQVEELVALLAALRKKFDSELHAMREYRERLITDVVTGKVDVRHVEIPSEETTIDEAEELEADEEGADDGAIEKAHADE
jgi:type I restriction enzyme S subunit